MAYLRSRRNCVLVVDDEEEMRQFLAEYLNEFGYQVDCAANGQEAIQKYKNGHFDVVLSDLSMSPMNGLELLGEIRKMDSDVVFIMMTGYPSLNSAMEAMKMGAADYITKPFNVDEIRLKIDRVIVNRRLKGRLKNVQAIIWALVISIPVWLVLGIILAHLLR